MLRLHGMPGALLNLMSYARPQITTRIIPRQTELAVRPGLTVLVGRPDTGIIEYANSLEQHPQHENMHILRTAQCDKHVQRDVMIQRAIDLAAKGEVVVLEWIGLPTIDATLRCFYEAGISSFYLQSALAMIVTFQRQNGRIVTEVHRVEVNRVGRTNRPFVGC